MSVERGITLHLSGPNAEEVAKALMARLTELGRQGDIVVVTGAGLKPNRDCLEFSISPHDTPEFAAEKVLDALAESGIIALQTCEYTPEEEEQVRRRLADLGYLD